jgi:predicted ATP-dependent serine protease
MITKNKNSMDSIYTEQNQKLKTELIEEFNSLENNSNCFKIKTVSEWIDEAKKRPIPKMLFSELWFENELCILFSDTNLGKSALAIQIANSITKGFQIPGFKLEVTAQKVLIFDFELSDKQLEKRYSNEYADHYEFNSYFFRAEINNEQETPENFKTFEDYLCSSIEEAVKNQNIKILIIDNLTYLNNDTEKARDALKVMKHLNNIKKKHNLSILVLAHTPKRDSTKPLTKNDLSGSKMLMNFCDSCFAIGESFQENGYRYLKQIKQRNTENIYNTYNVIICKLENPSNFLQFSFIGFENEFEHLKQISNQDFEIRNNKVIELSKQNMSNVKIAEIIGCSEGTIRNTLKKLQ